LIDLLRDTNEFIALNVTKTTELLFEINSKKTDMKDTKAINKDLILRERLALQRTVLANQSTFLAFLRTAMYFLIAGLSLRNLLKVENSFLIEMALFVISFVILLLGTLNYFKHKKSISENKKHIGDYQLEYYE
jgi:putative membrane protein